MTLQEKIDLREHNITEMRAMNDAAKDKKGEARSFTAEETGKYNKLADEVRKLTTEIAAEKRELEMKGFSTELPKAEPEERSSDTEAQKEFRSYLMTGKKPEKRDLTVSGDDGAGVFAPEQFVNTLIAALPAETPLLSLVNMITLTRTGSIGAPVEKADASDADWTSEIPDSVAKDSTWKFAKRELSTYQLIKAILVSKKLLAVGVQNADELVRTKLASVVARTLEKGILTGTGTNQPLGVFVASANGISTARDVTAKSATALSGNDIIETKQKLRPAYRKGAVWLFHTDAITQLLELKDNNGQYLWRSGLVADAPDTLNGLKVIESEFAPSTFAASSYIGLCGNFDHYWMTMLNKVVVQVLVETYAEKGMNEYLATLFADGAPVQEQAFSRIKLASA